MSPRAALLAGLALAVLAAGVYLFVQVRASPAEAQNWLGLMRAQIAAKNPKAALETAQRIPATVRPQIETRSDYLRYPIHDS